MINLKNVVCILSVVSLLLCLFQQGNQTYTYIFVLPLTLFFLSLLFFEVFEKLKNSIVYNILMLQVVIRFCVLPFKMASGDQISIGSYSLNGNSAIFIMVFELVLVFIALHFISSKQYTAFLNRTKIITPINNSVFLYMLTIFLFVYIYSSGYLSMINFIWDLEGYIEKYLIDKEEIQDTGFADVLFSPFKVIIALILVSRVYLSTISYGKKKYFYLAIIFLGSIFMTGVSRFSMLHFILPLLILITMILDKKNSKQIIITALIALVPILILASISKFTRDDNQASSEDIFSTSSLSAYFAGPGSVAVGVDSYEDLTNVNNGLFFVNDVFQNIPLLSEFTTDLYKTNVVFNEKIYRGKLAYDQIVPLSTSGLFHFGILGSFIYATIFLLIAFYFERKFYKEKFLGYKYVYISLSTTLSMVFMLNVGSFYFSIVTGLLFIYLPFYFINRLQLLQR